MNENNSTTYVEQYFLIDISLQISNEWIFCGIDIAKDKTFLKGMNDFCIVFFES